MPSTYSHYYFGQLVYKQLSQSHKEIIDKNHELYEIGLNGPDVLLYHAPLKGSSISKQNHEIHTKSGKDFFFKASQIHQNRQNHLAYLYGYLCHFVLDAYCHPYIEKFKDKKTVSHMAIEREFECYLLRKNHLNPKKYNLTSHIKISNKIADVMSCYVKGAKRKDLIKTLFQMKVMYSFTKASSFLKRKIIYCWMDSIKKPYLKDFVFVEEVHPIFLESNEELFQLLNKAIYEAQRLIESFNFEDDLFNEIFG